VRAKVYRAVSLELCGSGYKQYRNSVSDDIAPYVRRAAHEERRACPVRPACQLAGVISAGSSAPDLCGTTLTLFECTIGCAYWMSGST
jgi:hypothetical protein